MRANRLRLWFASFAYVLLEALRRIRLRHSQFANATCGTIRLKLLKIGALVRISVRRIKVAMLAAPRRPPRSSLEPGKRPALSGRVPPRLPVPEARRLLSVLACSGTRPTRAFASVRPRFRRRRPQRTLSPNPSQFLRRHRHQSHRAIGFEKSGLAHAPAKCRGGRSCSPDRRKVQGSPHRDRPHNDVLARHRRSPSLKSSWERSAPRSGSQKASM